MNVFYRPRPGWEFPRAVRAEGACVWGDKGRRFIDVAQAIQAEALRRGAIVYASGGQADGRGDLIMLGPPLAITTAEVDEAIAILGDVISAVIRAR